MNSKNQNNEKIIQYKEVIVEMVARVQNDKTLKRIYKIVLYLYTHEFDEIGG